MQSGISLLFVSGGGGDEKIEEKNCMRRKGAVDRSTNSEEENNGEKVSNYKNRNQSRVMRFRGLLMPKEEVLEGEVEEI